MNDELGTAWTTLRTTPLGSLDNDIDLERVEKAILTVLVALERAMPLLPLADILKLLEDLNAVRGDLATANERVRALREDLDRNHQISLDVMRERDTANERVPALETALEHAVEWAYWLVERSGYYTPVEKTNWLGEAEDLLAQGDMREGT